jgi:hypothetical protein
MELIPEMDGEVIQFLSISRAEVWAAKFVLEMIPCFIYLKERIALSRRLSVFFRLFRAAPI